MVLKADDGSDPKEAGGSGLAESVKRNRQS